MSIEITMVTCPDRDRAESIARTLIEERLAGCVNIIPSITSVYRWEGNIQVDNEVLLILKSTTEKRALLETRVMELHPYDTPEFVSSGCAHVNEKYASWLLSEK